MKKMLTKLLLQDESIRFILLASLRITYNFLPSSLLIKFRTLVYGFTAQIVVIELIELEIGQLESQSSIDLNRKSEKA